MRCKYTALEIQFRSVKCTLVARGYAKISKHRAQYQNAENIFEKTVIIERIKLIKEHITDKMKENRSRRIIKVAQQIKSNVDNGGKIWEIKRKVQRKNQTPHTIKDEKNNRIEYSTQILEEYKKYYKNLLKTRQSETAEETQIQCKVEREFQQITNRQGDKKRNNYRNHNKESD